MHGPRLESRYANGLTIRDIEDITGVKPRRHSLAAIFRYQPDTELVWPVELVKTPSMVVDIDPQHPTFPYLDIQGTKVSVLRSTYMINREKGSIAILQSPEAGESLDEISGMRLENGVARPFNGPADMFQSDYSVALKAAAAWVARRKQYGLAPTG